jgi:serine O-acetyltransferase
MVARSDRRAAAPATSHQGDDSMSERRTEEFKRRLQRLWVISPERLWLRSIALQSRGHWVAAFTLKQLNTLLYHNSLSPAASVAPDIVLAHLSHGVVVNGHVEIGRGVKIWHNVTLTAGRRKRTAGVTTGPPATVVIEDRVNIGANAVVIAPRGTCLRIGRGARIGAGAVVTGDVPAGATAVSAPVRIVPPRRPGAIAASAEIGSAPQHSHGDQRPDPTMLDESE